MTLQIRNRTLFFVLLGVVIAFFLLGGYLGIRKGRSSLTGVVESLKQEIITYKAKIGQDSVIIVLSEQEVLSQKRALRKANLDNADLRALNIKLTNDISLLQFRIDTLLKVQHTGKIVTVIDTVTEMPENALLLPFGFNKTDKYMVLDGTFDEMADLTVDLKMDVNVRVITGVNRQTKEPTIAITTDNPYIKTVGIESFKTDVPKPYKWSLGIQMGYGLIISTEPQFHPYVGLGISRTILRF